MAAPPPVEGAVDADLRARREARILALLDAENRQDLEALVEVFPHPRYELIGTHNVYDGAEAVSGWLRERNAAFPDYRYELIGHHHADEAVIAEVWVMGTHRGPIEHIPPSGKGFRCRMAVFFLFDGERLTCFRIYFDNATIARQLA